MTHFSAASSTARSWLKKQQACHVPTSPETDRSVSTTVPAPGGVARVESVISKLTRTYWYSPSVLVWHNTMATGVCTSRSCSKPVGSLLAAKQFCSQRETHVGLIGISINQWTEADERGGKSLSNMLDSCNQDAVKSVRKRWM